MESSTRSLINERSVVKLSEPTAVAAGWARRHGSRPGLAGARVSALVHSHMIFVGIFMYFGALIIPLGYLMSTRWRGAAKRPMLIGASLQLFWSLAVWAFVYFSWRTGYSDYYYGWALMLPVNVVGLIYFVAVLIIYADKDKQ